MTLIRSSLLMAVSTATVRGSMLAAQQKLPIQSAGALQCTNLVAAHQMPTWLLQVCVGATVPEDRLHLLLPLLEPSGGKLLAPVDNDLRLYTCGPDGKLRQRVVSSVRFSDLEVRAGIGRTALFFAPGGVEAGMYGL